MEDIFFGKNLSFLRKEKGFKVAEMADNLGFSRTQWSNYENNLSYPKFIDFIKIAKYFDVSENVLIHTDIENYEIAQRVEDNYVVELQKKHIEKLEAELEQVKKENLLLTKENAAIKSRKYQVKDSDRNIAAEPKPELKK